MFKLKRLEITGFKSFADYTEIVFTGDGITAVVGPNGCGKSNVSDAISWVLGEQSPKSLRGQEMKDVVFQGTGKRNPGGMAEVVLHLERDGEFSMSDEDELEAIDARIGELDENAVDVDALEAEHISGADTENEASPEILEAGLTERGEVVEMVRAAQVGSIKTITTKKTTRRWRPRSFELEFAPGEAVSVTRRLYLSGDSEYLLNDKTCRLRDIQDLFAGTGLSGAHYAIIEQGRIGQILSSKPSDRRGLIEEAAGISKFKTRQRAAESRLDAAKANLGRISDIVEEIEKRTRSLRRQANKTRRYRELKEELRDLQAKTYAVEAGRLNQAVTEIHAKLRKANEDENQIKGRVDEKENALRVATRAARLAEEGLSGLRAEHARSALERDRGEREKLYLDEQVIELRKRIDDLQNEITATKARIEGLESEITHTEVSARTETEAAELEKAKLAGAEQKYLGKAEKVRGLEDRLDVQRAEHLQHTAAVERLSEIGRKFEADLDRFRNRTSGLENEKKRAEESLSECQTRSAELASLLGVERKKLEESRKEKQAAVEGCEAAREALLRSEETMSRAEEIHSRNKHRLDTLRELEETGAIYEPSVQKLMSAGKGLGVSLRGILADRLKPDPSADKAVESLFGSFLQSVLVNDRSEALKVVEYLHKNGLGRIPVLVSDNNGRSVVSPSPEIIELLGIDQEFGAVLAGVFPKEMTATVVENLNSLTGSEPLAVSKDGDVVVNGRLFISGFKNNSERNTSLLGFKRELRDLAKSGALSAKDVAKAARAVDGSRAALKKMEDGLVDLQSYIVQLERDLLSREISAAAVVQEIDRSERHKKVVEDELKQLIEETGLVAERHLETVKNAEAAEAARIDSGNKIDLTSAELADHRKLLEEENITFNRMRTSAEVAAERMRAAVSSLKRVSAEKAELESRLDRQTTDIGLAADRIAGIEKRIGEITAQLVDAENEIEVETEQLSKAVKYLESARISADEMAAELAEMNNQAAAARDTRAGIEVRNAELNTRLRNLGENCSHDLGIDIESLISKIEIEDGFDFEVGRERVETLRNSLENFGAINMLAVEELAETSERLDFLTSQRKDIIDSIGSAEEALREIKKRSRERFENAFEAINENFTTFFSELFGGGTGQMTLLESEDVLDAGIEIIAQPPGKRLQNMLLLSGGEKAMTAIALVLAIFKYRPSPFCLLDEVDAPLDDANVGRFVDRIATMAENTQFIVITHNKRTMEAARALYGVTMQEAGVSKIVSVRFD